MQQAAEGQEGKPEARRGHSGFRSSEVLRGIGLAALAVGLLTVGERLATLVTQETPWQRLIAGLALLVPLTCGRFLSRYGPARPDDTVRFALACALVLLLPATWWLVGPVLPRLAALLPPLETHERVLGWLALVDLVLIGPAALALGSCRQERSTCGRGAGAGAAVGFVLALPLTNVLIDQLGSPHALAAMVLLGALLRLAARPDRRAPALLSAGAAVLAAVVMPTNLLALDLERRFGPLLAFEESARDVLLVTDEPDRGRLLRGADARPRAAAALAKDDRLAVHLPVLLHGSPRTALLLGVGSGHGLEAATRHPQLRVDVIPESAGALPMRAFFIEDPTRAFHLADSTDPENPAEEPARFDLVLLSPPSPTSPAFDRLFNPDRLADLKRQVAPGGYFVTSLDLTLLNDEELHTILAITQDEWPEVTLWTTGATWRWLLVASDEPQDVDLARWRGQAANPDLAEELRRSGAPTALHLLAGFVGDASVIRAALPGEPATPGRTAWRTAASPHSSFGFVGAQADTRLAAILGADRVTRDSFGQLFDRMRLTESLRGDVVERVRLPEGGLAPGELREILEMIRASEASKKASS